MQQLGERICALRTKAGLSQIDLAEILQVSRQSVSKWETGAAVPELDKLVKLCEVFHISLDELVTGTPPTEPQRETPPAPLPHRSRAKTAGLFLLCFSAVAAILFVVLLGAAGILLTIPFLLPGLICFFAQKHPVLKALWADFFLIDAYLAWATGIRASQVLLTFLWTPSMNYWRLLFAWLLFLVLLALLIGTAVALGKAPYCSTKKERALLCTAAVVLVAGFLPLPIPLELQLSHMTLFNLFFFLRSWVKTAAASVLLVLLTRYVRTKRQGKCQNT